MASLRWDNNTLYVEGELLFDTVPKLWEKSQAYFEVGRPLTIDLKLVTHCNSAGFALLLEWYKKSINNRQAIQFDNVPEVIQKISQRIGLSTFK